MEYTKHRLMWLLTPSLLAGAGPAVAQERAPAPPERVTVGPGDRASKPEGKSKEVFECDGSRGLFQANVTPDRMTTFYFATPVLHAINPSPRNLLIEYGAAKVTVQPQRSQQGFLGNLLVTSRACDANIELWIVDRAEHAPINVEIRQRNVVAEELARIHAQEAERKRELAESARALEQERAALARDKEQSVDSMAAELLLNDQPLRPVVRETGQPDDPIRVKLGSGRWLGDGYYFGIELENPHAQPFFTDEIQVFDAAGTRLEAKVLAMKEPAGDHEGLLATLQPKQRIQGVIKLPRGTEQSITPLTVQIIARNGLRPVLIQVKEWKIGPPMYPVTAEDKKREERERRRQERERRRQEREDRERAREEKEKDRVTLHLTAVAGGIWLSDGLQTNRLDPTSLTGFGARVTYGFNRYFAFEADSIGASTGEARFGDATFEGMQGELMRSASLGRVKTGAVIRFGSRTVPTLRIGVGAQGASIDSRFLIDGSQVSGPGSSFDFNLLGYFGAGVDFRLGEHFVAGFGLSAEQLASSDVRSSIEAGLHIGYGWKP